MSLRRRDLFPLTGAGVMAGYAGWKGLTAPRPRLAGSSSSVVVVKAPSYSGDLAARILAGVRECGLDVRGKRVLLKPNLVEFDAATCINTDVSVVAAAVEVFQTLGAAEVLIGEGPGHRRDTYALAEMARYRREIPQFDSRFIDLNRDNVSPVQGFRGSGSNLPAQYSLARGSDRFSREDENTSLGRGYAVDEKFLRVSARCGLRLAQE